MPYIPPRTAQARFNGQPLKPQLAPPYQALLVEGQSFALGAIGTVVERNDANKLDRNGVAQLNGLKRADDVDVYVDGPRTANYDYTTPAIDLVAARAPGNIPLCLYVAAALRIRRAAAGLPAPSIVTGYNGIPGTSIDEFDDDPLTGGVYGTQIHDMRGYWLQQATNVTGGMDVPYAGFAQGEADSNAAPGYYYSAALRFWNDWLTQIETITDQRPRPFATQIGGYVENSPTNKTYNVCTEQVQAVMDVGGLFAGPWYPIPLHDNNVHPGAHGTMLMADTIAWGLVEVERGRAWPALIPTVTRDGADLVLTYPCRDDEIMALHDPAKYAPYGGFCPDYGFEAGTISAVSVSGNTVRITTASDTWAYAYQFGDVTTGESGGVNYACHRGLVRTSLSVPSVLVPGETLHRWVPSWRSII